MLDDEMANGEDYADTNTPDLPLTQEGSTGTHTPPASQYDHLPHGTTEEDLFAGGKTRGALRPEKDLAGCLLADTANGFNNLSRFLWTVAHRWPSASRFSFNCYRH